jgi:streptogramin lyase
MAKGGSLFAEKQAIKRVDLKSKTVASLLTAADGLESVTAIAFDPAGVLYIADAGDHRVRGLVIETKETFDLVGQSGQGGVKVGPLPGRVNEPSGVAVLPSGAVLISSAAENAVLIAR